MYDPTVGRWLEEDPMGFNAGDSNLYRYVENNPTDATDPSGMDDLTTGQRLADERAISEQEQAWRRTEGVVIRNARAGILESIPFLLFTYNRQTLLQGLPLLSPNNNNIAVREPPAASTTMLGGSRFNWRGVLPQGQYVQVSGCGPCVGLILYKDACSPTFAFHFSANDVVAATISYQVNNARLAGYTAYICGVETQNDSELANQSAGTLSDVLSYLRGHGVTDISYIPAPGMAVDWRGNPYWIYPNTRNFPAYAP
jgi:hypothetical protein